MGKKQLVTINQTEVREQVVPYFPSDEKQLKIIAEALGFSYELVYPTDENGYGRLLPNGNWTGALGMIQRHEADMTVGLVAQTEQRNEGFLFSFPFYTSDVTFMTRKHEYVPDTAVFLHPFSLRVWLSLIACVCIMPFVLRCLIRVKHSPRILFTSTLRSIVGQGITFQPQKPRDYFLLAFWIIGSGQFSYFYAAVLLAFLTLPSLHGIRTIEDLATGVIGGKYQCSTYPDVSIFSSILLNSSDPSMRAIGRSLEQNEGSNFFTDILETVADDRKPAFVGNRHEFLPYKDIYFISEENFFSPYAAIAVHKEFCCKSDLDRVIHRIWGSGIFAKLFSDDSYAFFFAEYEQYGRQWKNPETEGALTMTLLKGPLVFLATSHAVAFLIFLAELCIGRFNHMW